MIGQQVSTAAAATLAGRMAAQFGEPVGDPDGGLTRLFPAPEALGDLEPAMPENRARTLAAVVDALCSGRLALGPGCDRAEAMAVLAGHRRHRAVDGPGDRHAGPRATPTPSRSADLGVRRAAEALGLPASPATLAARAERWRPWRAYAVQYLWSPGGPPDQPLAGAAPAGAVQSGPRRSA